MGLPEAYKQSTAIGGRVAMNVRKVRAWKVLVAALLFAAVSSSWAQVERPDYDSGASAGSISSANLNSPESDGRPGVYYFNLGAQAFKKGDYAHAVDMYKVAASWAYKPAEYNLALMYFNGRGVQVDRARGAAWAVLAAERGEPFYTRARDAMVTLLTPEQFKRTDEIWNELKPTYGDAVALHRAKSQWRRVASQATGSHLGHAVGNLRVGSLAGGPDLQPAPATPKNPAGLGGGGAVTAAGVLAGGSEDGSIAYQQLQQSDNPYAAAFEQRKGTATVGALTPVKSEAAKSTSGKKATDSAPPNSSNPPPGL